MSVRNSNNMRVERDCSSRRGRLHIWALFAARRGFVDQWFLGRVMCKASPSIIWNERSSRFLDAFIILTAVLSYSNPWRSVSIERAEGISSMNQLASSNQRCLFHRIIHLFIQPSIPVTQFLSATNWDPDPIPNKNSNSALVRNRNQEHSSNHT